jgi:hypothetical protein
MRDRNQEDPIGGIVDLAGGLLGGDKNKKDDRATEKRDPGDDRISNDPDAKRKPTTRNVSGKTKAAREK